MDVSKINAAIPTAIPNKVRKLRIRCDEMDWKANRVESAINIVIV